jgi:hypothetical protein
MRQTPEPIGKQQPRRRLTKRMGSPHQAGRERRRHLLLPLRVLLLAMTVPLVRVMVSGTRLQRQPPQASSSSSSSSRTQGRRSS